MARKQKTRGAQYVAEAALTDLLTLMIDPELADDAITEESPQAVARHIVAKAWDVEHFPVAGKVTITLNLADLDKPADPQ